MDKLYHQRVNETMEHRMPRESQKPRNAMVTTLKYSINWCLLNGNSVSIKKMALRISAPQGIQMISQSVSRLMMESVRIHLCSRSEERAQRYLQTCSKVMIRSLQNLTQILDTMKTIVQSREVIKEPQNAVAHTTMEHSSSTHHSLTQSASVMMSTWKRSMSIHLHSTPSILARLVKKFRILMKMN